MGLAYPDPFITLSVNRFVSMTQGAMVLNARPNLGAKSACVPDAGNKIIRKSNNSFDVIGGNHQ